MDALLAALVGAESVAAFARGVALGLAVAAPVGPMGLLCMRRTLTGGFAAGLLSGLGVATADAIYGAIAAFGLVAVTSVLVGQEWWLRPLGGAALVWFGVATLRARPTTDLPGSADPSTALGGAGLAAMYASSVALTLANPTTILSFAALFAGLGLGADDRSSGAAASMVLGVFLGSASWWLLLASGITLARRRLSERTIRAINLLSGLALVIFGLLALSPLE